MEKSTQIKVFEGILEHNISQLIRKYGRELVFKTWEETKIAGGDRAYFSFCGWKPEMTLMEALECLEDYCDFVEAMIQKNQEKEKEKRESYSIPALFN